MTDEQTDEQKPEIRRIDALSDFKADKNLIAEVETVDGAVYEIPIRKLSLDAWSQVGKEVPEPEAPQVGTKKDGTAIYNENDPAWLQAKEDAYNERLYRRILACLRIDIPGKTIEARVKSLRDELPADVTQALGMFLMQIHNRWRRTVEARAETFHAVRTGENADTESDGHDDGATE